MFAPPTDAGGVLSRITHHLSHLDHYIKNPLINQQHRANITEAQARPRYKDKRLTECNERVFSLYY